MHRGLLAMRSKVGVRRRAWGGVLALLLATAGVAAAPPSHATAGERHTTGTPAVAACAPDTEAQGVASFGEPSSLVSVPRKDGRVEQFQYFTDDTAQHRMHFVWHRTQDEAGGEYGPWRRVSAVPVGPKVTSYVNAAEGADGRIEAFFPSYGIQCHTAQVAVDGTWSAPEDFDLNPPPYWGGVAVFADRAGRLHAFASTNHYDTSMYTRAQDASGAWQARQSMGRVPNEFSGLSQPSRVSELPDGRIRVVAHEWNADSLYWQITQRTPGGSWGPWESCGAVGCP
ncbi:hypothetical protein ACMA1D_12755 [Streptomyces sp. 796.1]|uniref:hypothetical protein n=1 Tax=Streptomyces sp. 796.1 TaxID=3163029 RepID=UPI0039C93094